MTEKFNLMKILNQKVRDEHIKLEGAIIAFRTNENHTGTMTLTEDLGVRLRLIQEAHIQEQIMERQTKDMVDQMFFPNTQLSIKSKDKPQSSYLG